MNPLDDPNHEAHEMYKHIVEDVAPRLSTSTDTYTTSEQGSAHTSSKPLPPILSFKQLMSTLREEKKPETLIEGILHKGARACLSGSSKAGKTWSLINLACSVSTGTPWLGHECKKGRVLYLDFELMPWFGKDRFRMVCEAMKVSVDTLDDNLSYWNLRDTYTDINRILDYITIHGLRGKFDLIVLDPYYKLATGVDENSAAEVSAVLRTIGEFSAGTGAAFFYAHHFSKGNKADADSIDRASGSGTFARDPDAVLTLTKHEEENCLSLEATLRNGPAVPDKVVEVDFPTFKDRPDLDPADLKRIGKPGRPKTPSAADTLVRILEGEGGELGRREWQRVCEKEGLSEHAFNLALSELKTAGRLATNDLGPGKPTLFSLRGSV